MTLKIQFREAFEKLRPMCGDDTSDILSEYITDMRSSSNAMQNTMQEQYGIGMVNEAFLANFRKIKSICS